MSKLTAHSPAPATPRVKGIRIVPHNETTTAKASSVKLRCGDCLHYKGTVNPSMGELCFKLGVGKGAVAPSCYCPNVAVFRDESSTTLSVLCAMISTFTPQKQRILMGMLRNAAGLQRTGFSFMECVYFSTSSKTKVVLSDYYKGFVAAKGPGNTLQIVGINFIHQKSTACVAFLEKESLMTKAAFDKERKRLVAKGLIENLPVRVQKSLAKGEDYEPPTLDTAEDFLQRNANASKKHKGEVRRNQEQTWNINQSETEAVEEHDGL